MARSRRGWLVGAAFAVVLAMGLVVMARVVVPDEADAELLAFLRGDEDGSTDAERLAHIDRAIALSPNRARYYEARAGFYVDHARTSEALSDLDRAIVLEDRPYLRFSRGFALLQLGELARASSDFDRAIAAQPDNTQFFRGRALVRLSLGRHADALADADVMVRDAPHWGESHATRGMVLVALGRFSDAIVELDDAIRLRPDLVYAWRERADARDLAGDAAGATADREEAARRVPSASAASLDPFRR